MQTYSNHDIITTFSLKFLNTNQFIKMKNFSEFQMSSYSSDSINLKGLPGFQYKAVKNIQKVYNQTAQEQFSKTGGFNPKGMGSVYFKKLHNLNQGN